jgi:hypothetical protein
MRCNRATAQAWEQFTVVDAGGGKIALRSMNKYVSSENGVGAITCNRTSIADWERFDWIVNPDGKISLRGNNGRYISSENGTANMTCNRTAIGGWEAFTWSSVGGGSTAGRVASVHDEDDPAPVFTEEESLSVFPNPARGSVTIRVAKPSHVDIIDVTGKAVLTEDVDESITVNNLVSGLYIVNMNCGGQKRIKKLVIN